MLLQPAQVLVVVLLQFQRVSLLHPIANSTSITHYRLRAIAGGQLACFAIQTQTPKPKQQHHQEEPENFFQFFPIKLRTRHVFNFPFFLQRCNATHILVCGKTLKAFYNFSSYNCRNFDFDCGRCSFFCVCVNRFQIYVVTMYVSTYVRTSYIRIS